MSKTPKITKKINLQKTIALSISVISVLLLAILNSNAYALGRNFGPRRDNDYVRRPQIFDEVMNARCERIGLKAKEKLNFYNSKRDSYQNRHEFILQRIDEIIKTFDNKGYDLTKIKADREHIANLKDEFAALHEKLRQSLDDIRTSTCNGANKEEFDAKLEAFKNNLRLQREKAREIRSYVQNILIPSIRELRSQVNG